MLNDFPNKTAMSRNARVTPMVANDFPRRRANHRARCGLTETASDDNPCGFSVNIHGGSKNIYLILKENDNCWL